MTIKDLIEELKKCPENYTVILVKGDIEYDLDHEDILQGLDEKKKILAFG